jgi:hypothetical protein
MIKISTTGAEAKKAGATSAGEKKGERSKWIIPISLKH